MVVEVEDRKFRVQYVHSGHDIVDSSEVAPGGLRQFVDNLAKSLHRRVTMAEIAEITEIERPKKGEPSIVITPLAQGFAVCHFTDQFVKSDGRGRALLRAIKRAKLTSREKDEIAGVEKDENGIAHIYSSLKAQFSGHAGLSPATVPGFPSTNATGYTNVCKPGCRCGGSK